MSQHEVDALLAKLRAAGEDFSESDRRSLVGIVETWAHLIEVAAAPTTSMRQIRRLLGLPLSRREPSASDAAQTGATATEETSDTEQAPNTSALGAADFAGGASDGGPAVAKPEAPTTKRRDAHGRRGPEDFTKLAHAFHRHSALHAGDSCPECTGGRVYKYRPSEFTTVSGQSPLLATRHTVETLQCNLCKAVFKAPLPDELEADGIRERTLYSYSAVAVVTCHRLFAGLPMHRQAQMQRAFGVPVPDASIWDMCERMADALRPIWRVLHVLARSAVLFYGDDTSATILDTRTKVRRNRKTGLNELRTGCHTTCIIAVTQDNHAISLFATGIHHTGEMMDLVVAQRDRSLPPPIFMGDCIASNTVTAATVLYAGCNAHSVRRFKALAERYPVETDFVLSRYKAIFEHEAHCVANALTGVERRDHHRTHSKPLLREITEHGYELFEQRKVEPNSDLGAAFNYVIDNEHRLSAFARHPHAPLENNKCERELRVCVRLRDTARFFRNTIGASVADCVLTVGASALSANQNLLDYFVAVQRHAQDVRAHPELWVPWSYQVRLAELTAAQVNASRGPAPPASAPA